MKNIFLSVVTIAATTLFMNFAINQWIWQMDLEEADIRRQLADHALYACSKQNKVEVSFRENKEGDCSFIAMGAE